MKHDRRPVNYFQKHRPAGDSLRAKIGRMQQDAVTRPVPSMPRVLFLELSGPGLWAALAGKRGRA